MQPKLSYVIDHCLHSWNRQMANVLTLEDAWITVWFYTLDSWNLEPELNGSSMAAIQCFTGVSLSLSFFFSVFLTSSSLVSISPRLVIALTEGWRAIREPLLSQYSTCSRWIIPVESSLLISTSAARQCDVIHPNWLLSIGLGRKPYVCDIQGILVG